MPKSRRNRLDPELLKKFEDLERRFRETSKRIAVELDRAEEFRRYLREKYRINTQPNLTLRVRYWLFQANPARWRIFDYLRDHPDEDFSDWDWSIARHRHDIRVRDGAVLWISGPDAQRGVYAIGKIIEEAEEGLSRSEYWTDPADSGRRRWRVHMAFEHVLFDAPILARELRADPRFAHASIVRTPRFGNPHELSLGEWRAILDQIR